MFTTKLGQVFRVNVEAIAFDQRLVVFNRMTDGWIPKGTDGGAVLLEHPDFKDCFLKISSNGREKMMPRVSTST